MTKAPGTNQPSSPSGLARRLVMALGGASAFVVAGCASFSQSVLDPSAVEVRYTGYGVAHITAGSFEGAGFGYGWAYARDNLCLAVEHAVTLAGQRSVSMGPDDTQFDAFAGLSFGANISNFQSDVFFRAHFTPERVAATEAAASDDMRALTKGFVDGVNAHIEGEPLPGETCREQPWFRAISEDDIWRRALHIPILQTSNLFLIDVQQASPPEAGKPQQEAQNQTSLTSSRVFAAAGSNAVGFGRDMTAWGGGMSFANPHYAWSGAQRFHAVHLNVPGRYNVFGGTFYNFPVPLIGVNDRMGWSITYVTDKHVTAYELELDPQSPTRYRYGDAYEDMTPVRIEVPVLTDEGVETRTHTLWQTRYGFIFSRPNFDWTQTRAYALADPQLNNLQLGDQFLDVGRAETVRQVKKVLGDTLAAPWSNIVAADADGEAFFGNFAVTPAFDDETLSRCEASTAFGDKSDIFRAIGVVVNGSDPDCGWSRSGFGTPDGVIQAKHRPWSIRTDFLHNSNDSHWLPGWDADSALEGYARIIGAERIPVGERARLGAKMALARRDGSDGLGEPGVDFSLWEKLFFDSRNLTAELILDDLIADCQSNPTLTLDNGHFDLTPGCEVLARWDRRVQVDSRGATLFHEFLSRLDRLPQIGYVLDEKYWAVPFDPEDPIATPRGFVPTHETRVHLMDAAIHVEGLGFALDARLGDVQALKRSDGEAYPMSGARFTYNLMLGRLSEAGYGPILFGNSYSHIVDLTDDGPRGRFIVPFSQSTNPESPHANDMTALFSQQSFADLVFAREDVVEQQVGETIRFSLSQ